ncbi:hypothetical protein [Nonomuraea recticatena]|uniref:Uncharacterized protein n=1 Tax=Nonomuraea recticatena TaxID=46178 RepID=A0ABN3THG1_9ACTN
MEKLVFSPQAIDRAARGIDALSSLVGESRRVSNKAAASLAGPRAFGGLGEAVGLRDAYVEMANEFSACLKEMEEAIDGARDRLRAVAANLATADIASMAMFSMLAGTADEASKIRKLNPASEFYQNHRLLNGIIENLPWPLGALGRSALGAVRFMGDLTSGDKYNIITDLCALTLEISTFVFGVRAVRHTVAADPLNYLFVVVVQLGMKGLYWTKDLADFVTGDPLATGQAAYEYDSIAESCRKLVDQLEATINNNIGNGAWEGEAAEAARARIEGLRDGISHVGSTADSVAATLQLASSIIGTVEHIVIAIIADLLYFAVAIWFNAQFFAPATMGQSQVVAATRISNMSATAATTVGKLIQTAAIHLRQILKLVQRIVSRLQEVRKGAFAALRDSPWGRKHMEFHFGAPYYVNQVRADAGLGRHAAITPIDLLRSERNRALRSPLRCTLQQYGFDLYRFDQKGNLLPQGNMRFSVIEFLTRDSEGKVVMRRNWWYVGGMSGLTLAPFGRFLQYDNRADAAAVQSPVNWNELLSIQTSR